MKLQYIFLTGMALTIGQMHSNASLLVYEGFSYGLGNNANISGTTSTGLGEVGNWAVTNALPGGGAASSTYQTAGLSLGPTFAGSGGALQQVATFSGSNAASVATVQYDNFSVSGDLWGSYLANYSTISAANGGFSQLAQSATSAGATSTFQAGLFSNTTTSARQFYTSYDISAVNSANTNIGTGTTLLFISHYTNVGAALGGGTNGTAVTWVMTQAQYEAWNKTEAGLNALTVGSGLTAKTATDTVTSSTFNFGQGGFLSLSIDAPNQNGFSFTGVFDEVRFGTTLGDVAAVPEPSTWVMVASSLAAMMFVRRRRIS